jgi:hypothetical protein
VKKKTVDLLNPKVKSMEVSNKGRVTIKFNQNMQFDEAIINKLNEGKGNFQVIYISGYRLESDENSKNSLTKYEVVEAKQDIMKMQLTFSNPVYVSSSEIKCQVLV